MLADAIWKLKYLFGAVGIVDVCYIWWLVVGEESVERCSHGVKVGGGSYVLQVVGLLLKGSIAFGVDHRS